MAGKNELDRPLLALLDENTARAREAGQVHCLSPSEFLRFASHFLFLGRIVHYLFAVWFRAQHEIR